MREVAVVFSIVAVRQEEEHTGFVYSVDRLACSLCSSIQFPSVTLEGFREHIVLFSIVLLPFWKMNNHERLQRTKNVSIDSDDFSVI